MNLKKEETLSQLAGADTTGIVTQKTTPLTDKQIQENKLNATKQTTANLIKQINQLGYTEDQAKNIADTRNIFQKWLNLNENQGVFTGLLRAINIPAEAIQGLIASGNTGEDVNTIFYNAFFSKKDYTLKDVGVEFDNPLISGVANLLFEAKIDPFDFINLPIKAIGIGAKNILKKAWEPITVLASRSAASQELLNSFQKTYSNVVDSIKRTFGTWGNSAYKQQTEQLSNLTSLSRNQNSAILKLNSELYQQENQFSESVLADWSKLSKSEQQSTIEVLNLGDDFANKINSVDEVLRLEAFDTFKNKLSTFVARLTENEFTNGTKVWELYETLGKENGQWAEVVPKTIEEVKKGEVYKQLEGILDHSLKKQGKVNWAIDESLIVIKPMTKNIPTIGGFAKDGLGNNLKTIGKQGFFIELTEEGRSLLNYGWNNIKQQKLYSYAMAGTDISQYNKTFTELITTGFSTIKANNLDQVKVIEDIAATVKNVTNKDLPILYTPIRDGWLQVRFAPSQQQYNFIKSIDANIAAYDEKLSPIQKQLADYNAFARNKDAIATQIQEAQFYLAQQFSSLTDGLVPSTPKQLVQDTKLLQETYSKPLADLLEYRDNLRVNSELFEAANTLSEGLDLTQKFQQGFGGFQDLVKTVQEQNAILSVEKVTVDFTKANIVGDKFTIPLELKNLTTIEKQNLIAYMIEKELMSPLDLQALGIKTLKDFETLDINKLSSVKDKSIFSVALSQEKDSLINLSEFMLEDFQYEAEDLFNIMSESLTHLLDGVMVSKKGFKNFIDIMNTSTTLDFLSKSTMQLNKLTQDELKNIDELTRAYRVEEDKINKWLSKNNYKDLKTKENSYLTGLYGPDATIAIQSKLTKYQQEYPNNYLQQLQTDLDEAIVGQSSLAIEQQKINKRRTAIQLALNNTDINEQLAKIGMNIQDSSFIQSSNKDILFNSSNTPLYIKRNSDGHVVISKEIPAGLTEENYAILDVGSHKELVKYIDVTEESNKIIEAISESNNTITELQFASYMSKYPTFKFTKLGLEEIKRKEFSLWNNQLNNTILSEGKIDLAPKDLDLTVNNERKVLKEADKQIKNIDTEINNLNKTVTDKNLINTQPETIEKAKQQIEDLKKQRQELLESSNKSKSISNNKVQDELITPPASKFEDMQTTLKTNLDNDNYLLNDPLTEADLYFKNNDYIKPMLNDLALTQDLLKASKFVNAINDNTQDLYNQLSNVFKANIDRFVGVQSAINAKISSLFKQVFDLDMENWNLKGYMRHALSPEMLILSNLNRSIEGFSSTLDASLMTRNLKKLSLSRKYKGSAFNVNEAFGIELFNTNHIEATAIMLDIVPNSFTLAGAFRSLIDNNVLREVGFGDQINSTVIKATRESLQKKVDFFEKISKSNKATPYQLEQLKQFSTQLDNLNEFEKLKLDQQSLMKSQIDAGDINKNLNDQLQPLQNQKKLLKQNISSAKKINNIDELSNLNKQLDDVNSKIKELENKKVSTTVEESVMKENTNIQQRLTKLSLEINKYTTQDLIKNDKFLHNSALFGKEYTFVNKSTIEDMRKNFELVESIAGSDAKLTNNWLTEFDKIAQDIESGKTYAIHKGVLDQLKRFATRSSNNETQQVWSTIQKMITNPFKKVALFSSGFHLRNIMTNFSNAYLAGISPVDLSREMLRARNEQKVFETIIKEMDAKLLTGKYRSITEQAKMVQEIIGEGTDKARIWDDYMSMTSNGIIGNTQFSQDTVTLLNQISNKAKGIRQTSEGVLASNKVFGKIAEGWTKATEFSLKQSKHWDDWAKIGMYRLVRDNPKYTKLAGTFGGDAKQFVKQVLFDYNNLTYREETYMKALFPFYTWARKNLEFQLKNFAVNSKRYNRLYSAMQGWRNGVVGDSENEQDFQQNYLPIWNSNGKITYVKYTASFLDLDNFLDGSAIVNNLTPIIKTPLEMITGYDFFTRRNISTSSMFPGFGLGFNNLLNTADIITQQLFNDYNPTYEQKKLAGIIGKKLIDTTNILKTLISIGEETQSNGILSTMTGLFPSVFSEGDIATSQYYNEVEKQADLQKGLKVLKGEESDPRGLISRTIGNLTNNKF